MTTFIRSIEGDGGGKLWIGSLRGLHLFDPETGTAVRYLHDPDDPHSLSDDSLTTLYREPSGQLWIGTFKGGLNRYDAEHDRFVSFRHDPENPSSLSSDAVATVLRDSAGDLWVGTDNGLDLFDPDRGVFEHYRHDPANPSSLSHSSVTSLREDTSGVIWVGTNTGGINAFSRWNRPFVHINKNPHYALSLEDNSVYSLHESVADPGVIWIGTGAGLVHRYDRSSQTITPYGMDPPGHPVRRWFFIRAIRGNGRTGPLWVAATDGLRRFEPTTGEILHYRHDPDDPTSLPEVPHIVALHIAEQRPEELWVGFNDEGLGLFDIATESFFYFTHDPEDDRSLSSNAITCIAPSHDGLLWVGTKNGLNLFDPGARTATRFYHHPDQPDSLSSNNIKSVFEDRDGTVWVGTNGGGLSKLSWKGPEGFGVGRPAVSHYLESEGLASNVVYGVLPDDGGNLWLSTNGGLSRFDPRTDTFRNFDSTNGLQSNEFNTGAFLEASDGALLFGGVNGFSLFHPDSITTNLHVPPIVFTDFQLFNDPEYQGEGFPLHRPIAVADQVILTHRQNVFSFEFAALDYVDPEKNRYAYRLEGFDEDWNSIGTRRFITFTNLPPGQYTLRARGSNNDAVWNEEGASIRITITPPWWSTVWAYVGYGLLGVGLLAAGLRFRLNRERLKHQLELQRLQVESWLELDQMKSRFFANISHELRTPLTLILGPMQQLLDGGAAGATKRAASLAVRNARQLLGMVNELLDLSKLEAGKLRLEVRLRDLNPLVRGILFAFESHAENRGITLRFVSDSGELQLLIDPGMIERVLTDLISNAIKFTPDGGEVRAELETVAAMDHRTDSQSLILDGSPAPHARISVWNSGAGIAEGNLPFLFDRFYQAESAAGGEAGSGIGLALSKELVELHRGTISVASREGEWVRFTVLLPLDEDVLAAHEAAGEAPDHATVEPLPAPAPHALEERSPDQGDEHLAPADGGAETIVLIVEDHADMRDYIADALSHLATVVQAADGVRGFETAVEVIPTLIVSDVMMPEMDGFELCRKLKMDERTSHVPVILLTAKSGLENKVEGLQLGADDYLVKPFETAELEVRVQNLIRQRRLLRERFSRRITLQPSEIAITPADEVFLRRLIGIIESRLDDPDLTVEWLAGEIFLSRSQLHRKLHALVDQSASAFIRSLRLERAVRLLEAKAATVTEIAYQVGFGSPAYFRRCFREQFGVAPSEYC